MVKIFREYDWHHVSLIVDETESTNTLIKQSMQSIFKETEFGYEIVFDIQSFSQRETNATINYKRLLEQSSQVARSKRKYKQKQVKNQYIYVWFVYSQ